MSRNGFIIAIFLAALAGGMIALGSYSLLVDPQNEPAYPSISEHQKVALTNYDIPESPDVVVPDGLNFIKAASIATKAVVHIKSKYDGSTSVNGFLRYRTIPSASSGSGVIISDNGYIATNNHVVNEASEIEVTLSDNRRYEAELIGTDPTTDLALLKIKAKGLNFLQYGDSDGLLPGAWVLAVGNPFELNSTVTAGIVSAKARNIGILSAENRLQIESFIQTDAAVNPGNSGGALVDLNGNLVGINTAIATQTGSYAGYSFAVPVTLVKKVMDDLLEFGSVQRGLLGIQIRDVALQSQLEDLDVLSGVYILIVNENSAAEEAGLKRGDIIIEINDKVVFNTSELQELVARNRPGDDVRVGYVRNGVKKSVVATLKKFDGNVDTNTNTRMETVLEGATFEDISRYEARRLRIYGGVMITNIKDGKWKEAGIEEGFVITEIDKSRIDDIEDLRRVLGNKVGERIRILGVNSDGDKSDYSMDW